MTIAATIRARLSSAFAVDVRLTVPPGITMLVGPSGAGKTTILRCLSGLRAPEAGHIAIGEDVVFDAARGINVPARLRRLGSVFQDLALFPHLTVRQNIEYGVAGIERQPRRARAVAIAESFRIASLLDRRPAEISGGERQRVALARALVTDPRGLLLDEPLTALDQHTRSRLIADLRQWNARHALPILYVTHAHREIFALGARAILIDAGAIVAEGRPEDVLEGSIEEPVARFAHFENLFEATITERRPGSGTMRCRITDAGPDLEVPIGAGAEGTPIRIGVRAGDILLAIEMPRGLSARNVIPGRLTALRREGPTLVVAVDAGAAFEVHVTPAAGESLRLAVDQPVWLVIKTHSCRLVAAVPAGDPGGS